MIQPVVFLTILLWAQPSQQRSLSVTDLQSVIDQLGDEFITHDNLAQGHEAEHTSLDDDIPHPMKVNNWGHNLNFGQISAVSVTPADQPVIFHRGPIVWDESSFGSDNKLTNPKVIDEEVIVTLDPDTGDVVSSFGKGQFYMPHGLTIDAEGNTFVTDVGLHQVMRFPAGQTKPDLVLGARMEPGSDKNHFCKPTAVAVSERTGEFFVADGYCNSRIMKFSKDGQLEKIINGNWRVPHSLTLFEDMDVLCVADREGGRVECIRAGLHKPLHANRDETGMSVVNYRQGVGRPYAIAGKGTALLVMSGLPRIQGITIDTASDSVSTAVIDQWAQNDGLTSPHDIAISQTGDAVYVVEVALKNKPAKVHKYEVINAPDLTLF